jgi:hypothetical protein
VPKQMLTLNDFSGGLNTKSSPRDIAFNQVQSASNAVLLNSGVVYTSVAPTSKGSIANEEIRNFTNTAFSFNTQYDITANPSPGDGTYRLGDFQSSPKEVITLHETEGGAKIRYLSRAFGTTGDFSRTENNQIDGILEPVFYYIDGTLYVADESHLGKTTDIAFLPRTALRFVSTNRFEDSTGTFEWVLGAAVATTADSKANIQSASSFGTNSVSLNVAGEFEMIYQIESSSGGGGFEAGDYEWSYTYVDLSEDESLPHVWSTAPSAASLSTGHFFTGVGVQINVATSFREKEKGFRIYTRRKDKNERWSLFLDVDYERGVRKNLFDDYSSWGGSGVYRTSGTKEVTSLVIESPALDTYDSINGYSHTEESIDVDGYKSACVAQRRVWICNVCKEDKTFDDRIYYTPVNRFNTFPDSYFLDIGINDGDSFVAVESLGNRIIAFKQSKIYVINVSSSSDAGWYLEAEYDGHGCTKKEALCKTPFGLCWANEEGVFIFDGTSIPKELTENISDDTWSTDFTSNMSLAFDQKYKQLYVAVDLLENGDNKIYVYDFAKQAWSIVTRSVTDSPAQSNFVHLPDGIYAYEFEEDSGTGTAENITVKKYSLLDIGGKFVTLQTKDIDFNAPGKIKKIYKVYVTARDAGAGTVLTMNYATDGSTSFSGTPTPANRTVNNSQYEVNEFTINADCESIALEFTSNGKIEISDITIEYRAKYKRAS